MMFSKPVRDGSSIAAALLLASGSLVSAATGPCDIYATGKTPCVAAHATTRALFGTYTGGLYQVQRASDSTTLDIKPVSAGGVANAAAHDKFCAGTTCVISIIYDQTANHNHLTHAPPGGAATGPDTGGYDNLAAGTGAPVTLNGQRAYGVFIAPGTGYRNNKAIGTAQGDDPEGIYAVLDGTHYNERCCFDYGNMENDSKDSGAGRMETIYFGLGDNSGNGKGGGDGPWIMADLENGLFSGHERKTNTADATITSRFVTAIVKGKQNYWSIRGGNSASGSLSTYYKGARPADDGPNSWTKMRKQGAIGLGTGGDNSDGSQGTFYEGVLTSGYPTDETENAVQANIVAAKYAATSLVSGPALKTGTSISVRVTTPNFENRYLARSGTTLKTAVVTSSSDAALKESASWIVHTGLGNSGCFSFESKDKPGNYIHNKNAALLVEPSDGTQQFREDATFCPHSGFNGKGNSFQSWNNPTRWIRHFNGVVYIAANGGPHDEDTKASWVNDVSFIVGSNFA